MVVQKRSGVDDSDEEQRDCKVRDEDSFFIHLLGSLQSHVITNSSNDVVDDEKVRDVFKNIYPPNLHVTLGQNDASDVSELQFLVKVSNNNSIVGSRDGKDGKGSLRSGNVQFLETELSNFVKSELALKSSRLVLPHLVFGVPVVEVHFSRCIGQSLDSSKKSGDSDKVMTVPAAVLVETKHKCSKEGESEMTSFQIPVDILHKTCSIDDLNREHLINLIRDQLTTHESTTVEINKHFKSCTKNNIPILTHPYHFPVNLWSPPYLNTQQSIDQKDSPSRVIDRGISSLGRGVDIVTEFLPLEQQLQMMTSEQQWSVKLREWRQLLHEKYHQLSENENEKRPLFRTQNAVTFKPIFDTQLVFDESSVPEVNLSSEGSSSSSMSPPPRLKCETVRGRYGYFHYGQDGLNDTGWGCAYRSLQTVWSWFLIQAYTHKPVISHRAIQETLHKIGDKPVSFVGSNNWIGSFEVSYVLDHHLDIVCAFINVQSGDQLVAHLDRIAKHFATHGTPIMVGGGVLAHTICGIAFDEMAPESTVRYLILDPHYTGVEDFKTIKKKSGFSWKPQSFWKSNAYYNLCLPQRPKVI